MKFFLRKESWVYYNKICDLFRIGRRRYYWMVVMFGGILIFKSLDFRVLWG